jgi:hypothetical protein
VLGERARGIGNAGEIHVAVVARGLGRETEIRGTDQERRARGRRRDRFELRECGEKRLGIVDEHHRSRPGARFYAVPPFATHRRNAVNRPRRGDFRATCHVSCAAR